jgi:cytochrome P450
MMMTSVPIADHELATLPIEDPAFAADPNPELDRARAQHPWLARFSHGYVVHSYQAIRDLLPRDEKVQIAMDAVVDIMGAQGTPWGGFMRDMMIAMRGADHQRVRGAIEPYFKPRSVVTQLERIREVVTTLLDEWAQKGEFDFAEFSAKFPVTVMFSLIGGDPADLPRIQSALEVQGLSFSMDPTLLPELEAGYQVMMGFTDELITQRRASGEPRNDLLQALIAAEDSGELSPKEVRELLFFLFGAGYDTSKNQLTLTVWMLLDRPDLWDRCATDRQYCVLVVEEAFRLASPSNVPRIVLEDIDYEGVHIPAGTHLLNNLAARDPTVVADPLTYDPERDQSARHLAFGRGAHQCLGMHLARLQIEEGLHLIAQRLKHPQLAGDVTWRRFPGVWGIASLPIRFTPAPAQRPARTTVGA